MKVNMKRPTWKAYTAAGVVALIVVFALIWHNGRPASKDITNNDGNGSEQLNQASDLDKEAAKLGAIAVPTYPEKTNYYDSLILKDQQSQSLDKNFLSAMQTFSWTSADKILTQNSSGANQLYSPISLYMALALTADGAQASTQKEIINALAMADLDITQMNEQTHQLFNNLYFDNEIGRLKFANSLWLSKQVGFNKAFLQKAAQDHYAFSYSVDFGAEETGNKINQWIADNTGGKLGTGQSRLTVDPESVMNLINTTYFYDEWKKEFPAQETKEDQFYLSDGSTVSSPFMNTKIRDYYVKGKGYSAAKLDLKNGESMVFILPDKGRSPYDLLENSTQFSETVSALVSGQGQYGEVAFKVPKFKFYSNMEDLQEVLKEMGIQRVFQHDGADFGNFSAFKPLYISKVMQWAYISIDEKGCEAAAYTVEMAQGGGDGEQKVDTFEMILDRPFLFVITKNSGLSSESSFAQVPLFIGVVNNPI